MYYRIMMRRSRTKRLILFIGTLLITASYYLLRKTPAVEKLQLIDIKENYPTDSPSTPRYEKDEDTPYEDTDRSDVVNIDDVHNTTSLNSSRTESNKTFLMSQDSEHRFNLAKLGKLLQKQWTQNKTNINSLLTKHFPTVLDSHFQFATKNNTRKEDAIRFIHIDYQAVLLPRDVYRALPAAYPFGEKKLNSCSVVGSSGILKDSCCGSQIDSADFVIRFNMPPLQNFTKDAGRISNITTINPSQIENKFNSLRSQEDRDKFLAYIKQYDHYLWISGFGLPSGLYLTRRVLRTIRSTLRVKIKILLGHPIQWTITNTFWSDRGVDAARISSGAYWLSSALLMCDEVHLYGFWPFSEDRYGNPLHYHYYEDRAPLKKILKYHHFDQEFQAIVDLHTHGIVQLHVDKCQC